MTVTCVLMWGWAELDISSLDMARLAALIPEGVSPGADQSSLMVGTVTGLNIEAGQVQVVTAGSEPVWVPAAPFIYTDGALVRLRRSPIDGGRIEYCEGPITVAPMVVTGKVLEIGDETLLVDVLGAEWELGYTSSTYDVGETVAVLRHPTGFGVPQWVQGIAGREQVASNPGGGSANPGQVVARQAVISPQDSGAWRGSIGRWNQWNANRWGGARALWQGNQYGSGPMTGWAGYGDQVANLHAVQITGMWVTVIRADTTGTGPRSLVLQGSPEGSRPGGAPSGGGEAAGTQPLGVEQAQELALPASTYEGWRTGGFKGLRTVGGDYFSAYGADRGGAMALKVQYTVVA